MDFDDTSMGLTPEQTEKILQFQDLTGIEDMSICRDVLQRHQWDLEVAIQEQLNIREGRPSVFATEARAPTVVHDHISQQVFTDEPPEVPGGVRGLLQYVVNLVVSMCYNTISSVLQMLLSFVRNDDRRLITDPLADVMGFINSYTSRYNPHPVFYQGTYAQALNDAKNELRFLIVYLHSDSSSETQNFCRFHRRSFHYPTYFEIMKEAEFLKAGVTRMLIKDQFIYMLNRWVIEPDMKHELKLAFKVFDTEKRNYLEIEELREIVTSYADPFDADEVIEFLRDVNVRGDGNVFYDNFIGTMFSVAPELYQLNHGYLYEDPDQDPSVAPLPPEPEPQPAEGPPPPPPPPAPNPPTAKDKTAKGKNK